MTGMPGHACYLTVTENPAQTLRQVDAEREILGVTLRDSFYTQRGTPSSTVLSTRIGWAFRIDGPFVVASWKDETYLVPLENVTGINVASAHPTQVPTSDQGTDNSATMPAAGQAVTRRVRAGRR
jgi:hypothetical protein